MCSSQDENRSWRALLILCAIAVAVLAAPLAGAQEPQQVAQAADPEPPKQATDPSAKTDPAADPDSATEPDSAAEPIPEQPAAAKPPPLSGIEEIVVRGTEGETTADFDDADSVTGFGAEDLAALGTKDIADLAAFTPNLEIVTAGATTPTFFIRGVGLNDFNSNSTGAVAIYQDDVAINAPALQLSTLFDVEGVNVLRGPQGTGLARNASAGAIKIYSRKPTGTFGSFLRSELGNYDARDFEGAIEAPMWGDTLAARLAFRVNQRDGTMKNRCGNAPPFSQRVPVPNFGGPTGLRATGKKATDPPWSICGEPVQSGVSTIPEGLAPWVNNINNWASRGTILFQPTLDMSWLVNAHGAHRDELSRLGQSIGTRGFSCANGDVLNCGINGGPDAARIEGTLGGAQGLATVGYQPQEIRARLLELAPCLQGIPLFPNGICDVPASSPLFQPGNRLLLNTAKNTVAGELAEGLDSEPWEGDFNLTGPTTNTSYGGYLRGEIALPWGMQLLTISGYDHYDRFINIDLDMSPETLFQIETEDDGYDYSQGLQLGGQLGDESSVHWDIGGWYLREQLNVAVTNDLGVFSGFGVGKREYTQDLWSVGAFASLAIDFWDDFTLDGGGRYNWENKKLDYALFTSISPTPFLQDLDDVWSAPTGTIRLTYRFREDTHAYWKYTRGWKPGTYNATSSLSEGVSVAEPETIDAFEAGMRGSWLEGRLGLDLSVFYYNYHNYQLFTAQQFAGGQPEFVILNAKSAEVYGAEVDAVARPWPGAFANARFGWLESQFLNFVQIQQDIIIVNGNQVTVNKELNNTGNPLLNSPRFKISLTGEQAVPIGRWGTITARYDGVWTDATYYDATSGLGIPNADDIQYFPKNTIGQPAFWIHNARLSYRPPGGRIEIAGFVRNITNKAYKTFAFDASTFSGTSIYFVGDPRTFGGSVTVTF